MPAISRLLMVITLFCSTSCGPRPVVGELIMDLGEPDVGSTGYPPPPGSAEIAALTSETFWRSDVEPLLSGQSEPIGKFLKSRATNFGVSLRRQETGSSRHLIYTFDLEFQHLTRAEAEIVLQAVTAAYEKRTREQLISSVTTVIQLWESHETTPESQMKISRFQDALAAAISNKSVHRITSSRILH